MAETFSFFTVRSGGRGPNERKYLTGFPGCDIFDSQNETYSFYLRPSMLSMIEEAQVGKRIKGYRIAKKTTLQELAKKTGFTRGYLSKIENTKKAPPVSTLIVLSKALNISLSDIFGETADRSPACLVKKKERPVMVRDGTIFGYAYQMLAHKFYNKHMHPYILTLPKDVKENPFFQHMGEEMLFVLEGTMRFFHGENEYLMEKGDCLYFDANIPHHGICRGKKEVKCLMVIYTPE